MAGFHEDGGNQKLKQLNVEINSCVLKLEELGQCGEVEGAQVLLKEVEALEKDRERERAGLLRDSSKVRQSQTLLLPATVLKTLTIQKSSALISCLLDPCRI